MNNNVIIGNELPEITQLKARLAAVEAQRDAARAALAGASARAKAISEDRDKEVARSNFLEAEGLCCGQQNATLLVERDAARAASEKDRQWLGRALEKQAEYLGQSQMLVAERDAAQAGEARAVEALQNLRIPLAQLGDFMYSPVRDASQELLAIVNSVLANTYTQPALDWLAQQRAEAAAKEVERIAANHRELPGLIQCDVRELQQGLRAIAAALRAGKGGE